VRIFGNSNAHFCTRPGGLDDKFTKILIGYIESLDGTFLEATIAG
jgi:hypothetical protein